VRRALAMAEIHYKRPVYAREVYYLLGEKLSFLVVHQGICFWALLDLYQNDEIMADKSCDRFSLDLKLQKTTESPDC
jgi:hypothetical protein